MRKRLRVTLAGQLAMAAAALLLTLALAACGSAAAPQSASAGSDGQAEAGSGHSSAAGSPEAATASQAGVLAAERRVKCPAAGNITNSASGSHGKPVPAGFVAVAVVECLSVPAIVPVAGTPILEVRRVAVAGLGPLLAALRLPSTPRSRNMLTWCVAQVRAGPLIALIGTGDQVVRPKVPVGSCGLPITAVQTSLNSLHWRTLSVTKGVSIGPHLRVPVANITPALP